MSTKKSNKNAKTSVPAMSWFRNSDIEGSLRTCTEILAIDFLNPTFHALTGKALFTLLVINLNDLLQKANAEGARVSFNDGIDPAVASDVTKLVNNVRNAAAHVSSPDHLMNGAKLTYNRSYPNIQMGPDGGFAQSSSFTTDVLVNYGGNWVHLERHVIRAFNMVSQYFAEKHGLRPS